MAEYRKQQRQLISHSTPGVGNLGMINDDDDDGDDDDDDKQIAKNL